LGFDVGLEYVGCHGAIDDPGRSQAVMAQSSDKGQGFPVPVRDRGHHPLTTWTTPPQARHLGIDTGLVNEDDLANLSRMGQQPGLTFAPNSAGGLDIRAFLLTGVRGFFSS
jgi:hypothetical protein